MLQSFEVFETAYTARQLCRALNDYDIQVAVYAQKKASRVATADRRAAATDSELAMGQEGFLLELREQTLRVRQILDAVVAWTRATNTLARAARVRMTAAWKDSALDMADFASLIELLPRLRRASVDALVYVSKSFVDISRFRPRETTSERLLQIYKSCDDAMTYKIAVCDVPRFRVVGMRASPSSRPKILCRRDLIALKGGTAEERRLKKMLLSFT